MAKKDAPNMVASSDVKPVLLMPVGRGRVGKTVVGNTTAQYFRSRGATLRIWDMDRQTTSHGLASFHPDAEIPPSGGLADLAQWLEQKINEQALSIRAGRPFDALLGVGGGDLLVKKLAEEVRLVRTLERMGIRPVAMHVVGPDNADLDYLAQVVADELFLPAATLIVLNGGLVADGRSVANAFTPILNHPALVAAMGKGAKVVRFPELSPMRQVSEGRLLFEDAAAGKAPEAGEPLSFFDQERVSIWLEEKVPAFFGGINPLWMPTLPHQAEVAA
ncbi:hypothetical protein E2C06_18105 [Dankookia rubra]|uniref:CobQ/CobB/MinD/ParA nucleotide binding domain-containing protein n=1 Tax=Dankookia rubra TaxID=1442381 RepID=A0A4R5QDC8_9PROT|nr:hypothetical protein [Dankookia rubra]TDH61154.1 hypothetical protein E2C06_18105 [Dankookia rubra]